MSICPAISEDSGLPLMESERPVEIVKKESHPVLFRQKREWIWNSLYVEEEKPAPVPYKIGQVSQINNDLRSLLRVPFTFNVSKLDILWRFEG